MANTTENMKQHREDVERIKAASNTSANSRCSDSTGSISDQVKGLEEAAQCAQQMLAFLQVNYARGGIKAENDTMFKGALSNWEMRLSSLKSNVEDSHAK
jgi:hypothetical protein